MGGTGVKSHHSYAQNCRSNHNNSKLFKQQTGSK